METVFLDNLVKKESFIVETKNWKYKLLEIMLVKDIKQSTMR